MNPEKALQAAKNRTSTLIIYQSDTSASDRYLIEVDPKDFVIWDPDCM